MNKLLIGSTIFILMTVIGATAFSDEDHQIRNSLQQFFAVLKSGNVASIESAIAGKMLEETKVLLQDNREYGDFLRKHYQEVEFQVEKIEEISDGAVADVNIIFSGEETQQFQFFLTREPLDKKGNSRWKIVEQKILSSDVK